MEKKKKGEMESQVWSRKSFLFFFFFCYFFRLQKDKNQDKKLLNNNNKNKLNGLDLISMVQDELSVSELMEG